MASRTPNLEDILSRSRKKPTLLDRLLGAVTRLAPAIIGISIGTLVVFATISFGVAMVNEMQDPEIVCRNYLQTGLDYKASKYMCFLSKDGGATWWPASSFKITD